MKNSEKPAYPAPQILHDMDDHGLTKRELFAMAAMQGILSNPANNNQSLMGVNASHPEIGYIAANFAAREAIRYADELLKQLKESKIDNL